MLGLYMLGTPLERHWGPKRFLRFYLSCGVFAGIAYAAVMATLVSPSSIVPIVGASGGVFAILLACAVLFPQFRLIFFLFPLPIRFAAVLVFGGMILLVATSLSSGTQSPGFWSDVAHLGGAIAGAFWIWVLPKMQGGVSKQRLRMNQGAWQKRLERQRREQEDIDRILDKIRQHGLNSISKAERDKLQQATKAQQDEERRFHR